MDAEHFFTMKNLSINFRINDRDCWLYLSTFLKKEEVCKLSQTCKGVNSMVRHIPFKKLVFDWTCGIKEIKILCKYSKYVEDLFIDDCNFAHHLLNDYPKLKNLTLIDCGDEIDEIILKRKYKRANINVKHERIAIKV